MPTISRVQDQRPLHFKWTNTFYLAWFRSAEPIVFEREIQKATS